MLNLRFLVACSPDVFVFVVCVVCVVWFPAAAARSGCVDGSKSSPSRRMCVISEKEICRLEVLLEAGESMAWVVWECLVVITCKRLAILLSRLLKKEIRRVWRSRLLLSSPVSMIRSRAWSSAKGLA